MSRTPDGTVPQPRSDTALFAHYAYKLEDAKTHDLNRWASRVGLAVGRDALRNAPKHAARLDRAADRDAVAAPWLRVDWHALDFFMAMVRLQLIAPRKSDLDSLEGLEGIVDLYVAGETALAIVVFERRSDRESLRLRLGDFGTILDWDEVDEHRPGALTSTFRGLARAASLREGLDLRRGPGG
ncbi:MAG TPA: hypothetical protein VG898_11225 [Solirubrobacterales bacterium]|nr:hypothetical protein [Solirubrobacterales bacterium]